MTGADVMPCRGADLLRPERDFSRRKTTGAARLRPYKMSAAVTFFVSFVCFVVNHVTYPHET